MNMNSVDAHITSKIDKKQVVFLSQLNYSKSIGSLLFNWTLILLFILLCESYWSLPLYIFCVILISARMHAIGTLAHEATHYMLVKNKKWNNKIAEWFITLPLFYSLNQYRKYHMAHHSHLNSEKDPDVQNHRTYKEFQFPLKGSYMFWIIFKDISGVNFFIYKSKLIFSKKFWIKVRTSFDWIMLIYYILVFAVLIYFNLEFIFLMYWIIPFITWLQFIHRVRTIAEHNAISEMAVYGTRTTLTSFFDKLLFGPNNTNYHAEHHLFPSVPFYNLPKLHKVLIKNRHFKESVHFTKGYFNVIKECIA
jgi:fatty acid desaturase